MWSEAHITILVSAGAAITVAIIALNGTKGTFQGTLLINEQKRRDECDKELRAKEREIAELRDKFHAEREVLESERDGYKGRVAELSIELHQYRTGQIGGMERRP
jgi:hypothetical protein